MRGPTLAIVLSSLIGCATPPPDADAVEAPASPPSSEPHAEAAPTAPPVTIAATGTLGDHAVAVKVPASTSGATAFRFGRESERGAWVATLPERGPLVSVAYGGGKIFVGGGMGSSTMYALDAKTGKQLWAYSNLADPGPTAAVYDRGELAFNTFSCSVEVLDAETGKTLWTKWLGSETPNQPAMAGNLLLAPHPGGDGYQLSAYKRSNGHEVWSSSIDGHILGAPIVAGQSVYVTTTEGTLFRIGLDGKRVWRQPIHATSAPWVAGDELHLAVRDGKEEAQVVLSAADGKRLRTGMKLRLDDDAPSGNAVGAWAYEGPRPVVRDGVRFAAMGNQVEARDAKTDAVLWTRDKPAGEVSSVVVAGPLAIFTTKQGELVALDRATGAQRMAFDFKVTITAQPIVAEGWMYIATGEGRVLAVELGDSIDGWHMWGGNAQHNLL
jgi:outer membrane protein assembly factor BamB